MVRDRQEENIGNLIEGCPFISYQFEFRFELQCTAFFKFILF